MRALLSSVLEIPKLAPPRSRWHIREKEIEISIVNVMPMS